mmetsp:Transcript_37870/g.97726  ORF Transcript_37870/g.97726 Transcript_37870/m.97726 type:complete len:221 (+) Transcript_37870:1790-2452(+)
MLFMSCYLLHCCDVPHNHGRFLSYLTSDSVLSILRHGHTQYVIVVAEEELLRVCGGLVYDTDTSSVECNITIIGVEDVVSRIVPSVAVNELEREHVIRLLFVDLWRVGRRENGALPRLHCHELLSSRLFHRKHVHHAHITHTASVSSGGGFGFRRCRPFRCRLGCKLCLYFWICLLLIFLPSHLIVLPLEDAQVSTSSREHIAVVVREADVGNMRTVTTK